MTTDPIERFRTEFEDWPIIHADGRMVCPNAEEFLRAEISAAREEGRQKAVDEAIEAVDELWIKKIKALVVKWKEKGFETDTFLSRVQTLHLDELLKGPNP